MSKTNALHDWKVNTAIKRLMTDLDAASLNDIVRAIDSKVTLANFSDTAAHNHRLDAGRMMNTLRARVENDGGNWWKWYGDHFAYTRRYAEKLLALANAENPVAAQQKESERNRASKAAQRERVRMTVVRSNPVDDILELIEALTDKERHSLWRACRENWPW